MTHNAHAHSLELTPIAGSSASTPALRLVVSEPQPSAAAPAHVVVPAHTLLDDLAQPPAGPLRRLWRRWLGPPAVDVPAARSDFGVFRAMYEIGSDYLPSSGTWPTP